MKKIIALLLAAVFIMALTACGDTRADWEEQYPWPIGETNSLAFMKDGNVQLTIDEDTLTPSGATFYMENNGDIEIRYGADYLLQIKLDGTWYEINESGDFASKTLVTNPNKKRQLDEDWSEAYGELPAGTYRLIKDFRIANYTDSYYVCCEFEIE